MADRKKTSLFKKRKGGKNIRKRKQASDDEEEVKISRMIEPKKRKGIISSGTSATVAEEDGNKSLNPDIITSSREAVAVQSGKHFGLFLMLITSIFV
jgi:hypothetical protein